MLDRFDVPGADTPRPVPGLPEATGSIVAAAPEGARYAKFSPFWISPGSGVLGGAGLGASTNAIYTHHGDLDVPAVREAGVRATVR